MTPILRLHRLARAFVALLPGIDRLLRERDTYRHHAQLLERELAAVKASVVAGAGESGPSAAKSDGGFRAAPSSGNPPIPGLSAGGEEPDAPYPVPVIVCGLPRSGTTFIRQLLNSHPEFLIFGEFDLLKLPSTKPLMAEIRQISARPARSIDPHGSALSRAALMWELWRSVAGGRTFERSLDTARRRFGMKAPGAEVDFGFYEGVFELAPPRYLYCVRHPAQIFRSISALEDWQVRGTSRLRSRVERSWDAFQEMRRNFPERVNVVRVDRVGESAEARAEFAERIFAFVGASVDESVRRFVANWPRVNVGRRIAAAGADGRQLTAFSRSSAVRAYCEEFGYTPGGPD